MKRLIRLFAAGMLALSCLTIVRAQSPAVAPPVKLFALDCGYYETSDLGRLSDTFEHAGERAKKVSPCWLIQHPKGNLLWELGLGDGYAAQPAGVAFGSLLRFFVPTTLTSQLGQLGLSPSDIQFVSVSHMHLDHLGNAPLFASSTWLINRSELAFALIDPPKSFVDPQLMKVVNGSKKTQFDGDFDVFGDGSVRILRAPGHTPGSQVLMLRLARSGAVILSGDLVHSRENFEKSLLPGSNESRADTLASMDRIRRLLRNFSGRLLIHHDVDDFQSMPKFPAFLD